MTERKLTTERIEQIRKLIKKVEGGEMAYTYLSGHDFVDIFHDLELVEAEVERLRNFMEGRKMLKAACPGCGDIINFAQAALEEPK